MSYANCEIRHSEHGECYEMTVDGQFYGNYDSVVEAAKEFERLVLRESEGTEAIGQ